MTGKQVTKQVNFKLSETSHEKMRKLATEHHRSLSGEYRAAVAAWLAAQSAWAGRGSDDWEGGVGRRER